MDGDAMTPELYGMLLDWRDNGTEAQRIHAMCRLSLQDAFEHAEQIKKVIEYPSLFQQATNLAHAVGSVVASVVQGETLTVPQEEQDRRLAVCVSCDKYDPHQHRCRICGCFANLKARLASQHCPDDPPKW